MSISLKELSNLYRTCNPKYTQYVSDGEGRDSYILNNNGGMCSEAERPRAFSTLFSKVKKSNVSPAPYKNATSFKYQSDGKGRDFYISHNSGGLQAPYVPGILKADARFIASLRDIQKRNTMTRFSSPKERERMRKNIKTQKLLVKRLTSNTKDWKEMSKKYKSSFLRNNVNKVSIDANNSYAYGVSGIHERRASN
jgi:hypothetical protein